MAEEIELRHLRDKNGKKIAPFAPEAAIYDEKGRRLSDKLKGLNLNSIRDAQDEALSAIDEKENEAIGNFSSQRVIPDMLSPEVMALIEASGGGTINNMPDGEDLTSKDIAGGKSVMQLADRPYNPSAFSGKGNTILRKNVTALSRGGSANILTQEMVSQPHTVYEVRYDFDLNGEEITVPEGCTLKFSGGSLRNGILNCNKTTFDGAYNDCFNGLKFLGTIINNTVYPSWFGIYPVLSRENITNQQDKFDCLSSFIRCQSDCVLTFESGFYGFGGEGNVQDGWVGNKTYSSYRYYALCLSGVSLKNFTIIGNNAFFVNTVKCHYGAWKRTGDVFEKVDDDGTLQYATVGGGFLFVRTQNALDNLEIYNVISDYTKERYYGGYVVISPTQSALNINADVNNLVIKYCSLYNNVTDGIANVGNTCGNVLIQFCNISSSGRSGISLDTANNAIVDNCNIYYSGDNDFSLSGYKFEGPGCAINSEPTQGHTQNLTITNCTFIGCAYTYISLGYTGKNANENVVINNINAKSIRTGYTITEDKLNQISIIENCPSFINGSIVKSLSITGLTLVNVMFRLDTMVVTNRKDDVASDKISINVSNVHVKTNHEIEILYNEKYLQNRLLLTTDFNTFFKSDNSEVTQDNKDYIINVSNVVIELVSNTNFKTNINGDPKLSANNIFVYIIESRDIGICNNSNIYAKEEYVTDINDITVINKSRLTKTTTDSFLYRAAKQVRILNDYDKNSSFGVATIPINRDKRLAKTTNSNDWGSYTKSVNFLKLATDDARERFFGIVGNNDGLLKELTDGSIIINDTNRSLYKEVLFSLIQSGGYSAFYGIKKGIPYGSISSLDTSPFTPIVGESVFYTKIKKPIWWDGSKWVDVNGEAIVE